MSLGEQSVPNGGEERRVSREVASGRPASPEKSNPPEQ